MHIIIALAAGVALLYFVHRLAKRPVVLVLMQPNDGDAYDYIEPEPPPIWTAPPELSWAERKRAMMVFASIAGGLVVVTAFSIAMVVAG